MPLLLVPPAIMTAARRLLPRLNTSPRLALVAESAVCVTAFLFGLPLALSVFPQDCTVPVSAVEAEFRGRTRADGSPVTRVTYNKGL